MTVLYYDSINKFSSGGIFTKMPHLHEKPYMSLIAYILRKIYATEADLPPLFWIIPNIFLLKHGKIISNSTKHLSSRYLGQGQLRQNIVLILGVKHSSR
jgi:hypothetical protein